MSILRTIYSKAIRIMESILKPFSSVTTNRNFIGDNSRSHVLKSETVQLHIMIVMFFCSRCDWNQWRLPDTWLVCSLWSKKVCFIHKARGLKAIFLFNFVYIFAFPMILLVKFLSFEIYLFDVSFEIFSTFLLLLASPRF